MRSSGHRRRGQRLNDLGGNDVDGVAVLIEQAVAEPAPGFGAGGDEALAVVGGGLAVRKKETHWLTTPAMPHRGAPTKRVGPVE